MKSTLRSLLFLTSCALQILFSSDYSHCAEGEFQPVFSKANPAVAKLSPRAPGDLPKILDAVASALVGKPYELGPLGEGATGDRAKPLYRLDAFDCTTFVETVMANAYCVRAGSAAGACLAKHMQRIRYARNIISFRERNHIPELDWLPNNQRRGYLKNVSEQIFPGEWKKAKSTIQRELWLASVDKANSPMASSLNSNSAELSYLPITALVKPAELRAGKKKELEAKLASAQEEIAANVEDPAEDAEDMAKQKFRAELAYLREAFIPNESKLAQIPSGTILNLVHAPVKDPAKAKLSPIVTHQGLILQRKDGAHIIHAAPASKRVSDQRLGDYLLRYVRSANYRGISLYQILPAK